MIDNILQALPHLIEPLNMFLMVAGLTGGIIVGALPGLTATMGVALMVPATFAMDATSGLIMLGAIYVGAIYGGANSACLICTPGTPSSVATTFDGWPMCQAGKADAALNTSLLSSSFGGILGTVLLLLLAAPLAQFAVQFGGPENFWLCVFGLSTIAVMSADNMLKGLISGALGLLVSTVGLDPHTAFPRFTFGSYALVQGIEIIPAMIGLFSFSQVLVLIGSYKPFIAEYNPAKGVFKTVTTYLVTRCKVVLMRSSLIGAVVGMLPGAGGEIASIIAYNESKRWDKDPSKYGKGCIEGVASSESANNAVIGGALIPMLTLGIPGSAVAAVILGALLAKGIQPGFKVFEASGDLAYTFIMSQFVVNLLMVPIGYVLAKGMARLLRVRLTFVAIAIVVLSFIGSYAIRNSMLDVGVVLAFGFVGYLCSRVGLDTGGMALGIILGPMIEENLGKCVNLAVADGSVGTVFLQSNIAIFLIFMTALSLLTPWLLSRQRAKKAVLEGKPAPSMFDGPSGVGSDMGAIGFTVLVVALFGWQARELSGLSLYFPLLLMVFVLLCCSLLAFQAFMKWKIKKFASEQGEEVSYPRVALMSIGAIVYAACIPLAGFYPTTVVFLFAMALKLNTVSMRFSRRMLISFFYAVAVSLMVFVFFNFLLNVPTPEGLLMESPY